MMSQTCIWLYGSAARGDADALSDVDILVAGHATDQDLSWLRHRIDPTRISIVTYTWGELRAMAQYGSLFLLHLAREARPLRTSPADERLRRLLEGLGSYSNVDQDLAAFDETIEDVALALQDDGSVVYELGVLATVFRHASVLACYLSGKPTFGRRESFRVACQRLSLDFVQPADLETLYTFRLHESRNHPQPPALDTAEALEWVCKARQFIERVRLEKSLVA